MNWFLITVGYSGLFPKAPGTAGSVVALFLAMAILAFVGVETLFYAALLVSIVGVKLIDEYEKTSGTHDDKRIVIDELAGMWIALSIAPAARFDTETLFEPHNGILVQIVLSFLLFRLYDIKKPSVIGRIDKEAKGGLGVMGDDIIAGFAAGISSAVLWQIWLTIAAL